MLLLAKMMEAFVVFTTMWSFTFLMRNIPDLTQQQQHWMKNDKNNKAFLTYAVKHEWLHGELHAVDVAMVHMVLLDNVWHDRRSFE